MPDVWTHILFGEEVLSEMQGREYDRARANATLYRFGTQGPDFFFYYKFWPWQKTNGIDDIGRDIQNVIGGQFIRTGVRYLKTLLPQGFPAFVENSCPQPVDKAVDNPVESEEYQQLAIYLMGFITHYALDAVTHPYVHYKCGVYKRNDPTTAQYYGNHKVLEAVIDTILLKEKRNLTIVQEESYRQIDLGTRLPEAILRFYEFQTKEFFQWELGKDEFNRAYLDMLKALHLFNDPYRLKETFVRTVKILSRGKVDFLQFFYPHTVNNSVDYLNRAEKRWVHPGDETEVRHESFDQLWEIAKERAKIWLTAASDYLQGTINGEELDAIIPNLSFSSGREPGSKDEQKMRHFEPIFDLK